MSYFLYIGNGILHLFHNLRIALPRPVLCSKTHVYTIFSIFSIILCGLHFFFSLLKGLDGAKFFLSYVLLTKQSFHILFLVFSITCTLHTASQEVLL